MITCDRRIPKGSTRNATFITMGCVLPGRVVVKEFNGSVIEYVPGIEAVADTVPVRPDANVDVIANAILLLNPNAPAVSIFGTRTLLNIHLHLIIIFRTIF